MNTFFNKISSLRRQGVLSDIDVEFCRFLHQLHPKIDDDVLKAACLISNAYQNGDVCIVLDDHADALLFDESESESELNAPDLGTWKNRLRSSPAIGSPGDFKPLILDETNRLYFHKLWKYEQNLASQILSRAQDEIAGVDESLLNDGLNRLFDDASQPDWQKVAAVAAVYNRFMVVSGGPGTGKTTTVARLLALLLEQAQAAHQSPMIALAAPTGKAAARMEESIREAKGLLDISESIRDRIPDEAVTIHQLLGARRHSSQFRYTNDNPLPYDIVIIDEASMIDQALMSKLMDSLLDSTRLVLLGDKDQLASVEAGSILGDICGEKDSNSISPKMSEQLENYSIQVSPGCMKQSPSELTDNIILLTKSYRFKEQGGINQLAQAINKGNAEEAISVLTNPSFSDIDLIKIDSPDKYRMMLAEQVSKYFKSALTAELPDKMLDIHNQFQILAAHRRGPWGVDFMNSQIEETLRKEGLVPSYDEWYVGKPVIINQNDYSLGLSNGDLGVCMQDEDGNKKIFFKTDDSVMGIWPSRLPDYSTAYALTVHKSQGSEFDNIILVLPDSLSKVLSRELLYTAVTRAKKSVRIIGDKPVITKTIEHRIARNSGLKDHLWESGDKPDPT